MSESIRWLADGLPFLTPWPTTRKGLAFCQPAETLRTHSARSQLGVPCGEEGNRLTQLVGCTLVPPAVPTLSIAALVEGGHGLVCRAGLKLHEIGTRMFAFGAGLWKREKETSDPHY